MFGSDKRNFFRTIDKIYDDMVSRESIREMKLYFNIFIGQTYIRSTYFSFVKNVFNVDAFKSHKE